jgi:hypothetical protein
VSVDVTVHGVRELERALLKLIGRAENKVVAQALRKSAVRARARVVENLSGVKVQVQTGTLRQAFKKSKIRGSTKRGFIRRGVTFPERDHLGITPDDPYYYPTAVEYGHGSVDAYPYMRPAIDEHKASEYRLIARDIGKGIEKQAGK